MVESPVPRFRSWEVVVEVEAAAINPVDYKMIGGAFFLVNENECRCASSLLIAFD